MDNIKPIVGKVKAYDKKFVKGFKEENGKLLVKFDTGGTWTVDATDRNYDIANNAMEAQTKYQVKEVLPAVKREGALNVVLEVLCSLSCAATFIPGVDFMNSALAENIFQYVTLFGLAAFSTLSFISSSKASSILKYSLFMKDRDTFAHGTEASRNMLNKTSLSAREAIIGSKDDEAINYSNLDKISYKDLQKIKENIETQETMQFDLSDPIRRTIKKRS